MVEDVRLAVIGHEKIVKAVVIVVADTYTVSPPGVLEARPAGHVRKSAIAIVVVEVIGRFGALRKAFQRGAIDNKKIRKAVAVVVDGRNAAAGALPDVLLDFLPAVDHARGQTGMRRNVLEPRLYGCS